MRPLAVIALLVALPLGRAQGQWTIGVEAGTARYRGSAHDTSSGAGPRLHPGDATTLGLHVDRRFGRLGVALRASAGTPGVSADGSITVSDKSTGHLIDVATLVTVRVGGIGPSGVVRAELGPALHLWKLDDDKRVRLGALGALAYEWPVAGRFSGAIRAEGTVSRSWFEEGDLPPEYDLRLTWRYGVTLGLRYRL
jgi:hypothetical protein